MRKFAIISATVALAAVLLVAFTSRPAVTLTVQSVKSGDLVSEILVSEWFPGSNYQSVVATVQLKNGSNSEIQYAGFSRDRTIPRFTCYYREAGRWISEPSDPAKFDPASVRARKECEVVYGPIISTGPIWGPATLKPGGSITFRADILVPKRACKVVVHYSLPQRESRLYDRLPAWIVQRLPWVGAWHRAETSPIRNGSGT